MNMNLKACNLSIRIIPTAHKLGSYDYEPYEFEAVMYLLSTVREFITYYL